MRPNLNCRLWIVLAVVGGLLGVYPGAATAQTRLTLKLAQEADSNPMRLSDGGSSTGAAARVVGGLNGVSPVGHGALRNDFQAIGRAFYDAPELNSVGLSLSSALDGPISDTVRLGAVVAGRGRFEPERPCATPESTSDAPCAINQNYRAVRALGRMRVATGAWAWTLGAGARHFAYQPDRDLTWYGATANTSAVFRAAETTRLTLYYDATWRRFLGDRTQIGTNGGVYIDEGVARRDQTHTVGTAVAWANPRWSLSLGYAYVRNVSNSTAKGYGRHQLEPAVTGIPFGDLLVRFSARIMRASYDVRTRLDASLNVDEEVRNRVRVVLEHPVVDDMVYVEAGWAMYAQAFEGSGDDEQVSGRFRRHVGHVGITLRLGAL